MASKSDDLHQSFEESPNSSWSCMNMSVVHSASADQLFWDFNDDSMDDSFNASCDSQSIEMFRPLNDDDLTSVRFSQAFKTCQNPDLGLFSDQSIVSASCDDSITQIPLDIEPLPRNRNVSIMSTSWSSDSILVASDPSEKNELQWDANGNRTQSPDMFAEFCTGDEEAIRSYQVEKCAVNVCNAAESIAVNESAGDHAKSAKDSGLPANRSAADVSLNTDILKDCHSAFVETSATHLKTLDSGVCSIAHQSLERIGENHFIATDVLLPSPEAVVMEKSTNLNESITSTRLDHVAVTNLLYLSTDAINCAATSPLCNDATEIYRISSNVMEAENVFEPVPSVLEPLPMKTSLKSCRQPKLLSSPNRDISEIERQLEPNCSKAYMNLSHSKTIERLLPSKCPSPIMMHSQEIRKNLESNLSVQDMDVTFSSTIEQAQLHQAVASHLPYLLNLRQSTQESLTNNEPIVQEKSACFKESTITSASLRSQHDFATGNISNSISQCFANYAHPMHRTNLQNPSENELRDFFVAKIEVIVLRVLYALVNRKRIYFKVPKRSKMDNCCFDEDSQKLRPSSTAQQTQVSQRYRIALDLSMLAEVYRVLKTGISCTKRFDVDSCVVIVPCRHIPRRQELRVPNRELYYSDPELTQSQQSVDTTIMDICFMLEAKPWELGVFSSSKGLLVGNLKMTLSDNEIIDCGAISGGITLPQHTTGIKSIETDAQFVLLVEKDTVFEKLLQLDVLQRLGGHCIMVTGRGYPDINTRVFLKKLWDQHQLPIYALVDADPYGIEIMLVYRFGSVSMSHSVDELAVPAIHWIGVYPSDIKQFSLPSMLMGSGDVARLKALIKRPYISESLYRELLILQTDGRKCEIEAVSSSALPFFLVDNYLASRIKVA